MAEIRAETTIDAPLDRVWDIVSDIDSEPRFWRGTKSVRNISRDGNETRREITIAFQDRKCMQTVTLHPRHRVEAVFTDGIIRGTKTIDLSEDGGITLRVLWDVQLSGMMSVFTGVISRHIRSGTENAIRAIKQEAEAPA